MLKMTLLHAKKQLRFKAQFPEIAISSFENGCICIKLRRNLSIKSQGADNEGSTILQSVSGVDFTNMFTQSFYRSQKCKNLTA